MSSPQEPTGAHSALWVLTKPHQCSWFHHSNTLHAETDNHSRNKSFTVSGTWLNLRKPKISENEFER